MMFLQSCDGRCVAIDFSIEGQLNMRTKVGLIFSDVEPFRAG